MSLAFRSRWCRRARRASARRCRPRIPAPISTARSRHSARSARNWVSFPSHQSDSGSTDSRDKRMSNMMKALVKAKAEPVPMVTGHEFVGTVADFGAAVTEYKVGQRVSGEGHVVCGHCRNCRAGRGHLCRNTLGVGVNRPGAFGEYMVIPQHNVVPIPDDVPDEIAAIFDPLGNAVHTALSFDLVGEDVLVTGAGPIGIMGALVAQCVGARKVVITESNQVRLGT